MKDLILVGGGHSHVEVLKQFGMRPERDLRLTLISRDVDTPYSGMLPGVIAGHYDHAAAHIDLHRLARFAGARAFFDEAIGLDLARRVVYCRSRPPVPYDLLSLDIGSTPNATVRGAAEHAIPVKPIDRFLHHWEALRDRLLADEAPRRIAVVGGGAGGVELLLSVQFRMRMVLDGQGRSAARLAYHLFTSTDTILPTHNARVRRAFQRILQERGVQLHTGRAIAEVGRRCLQTADGETHALDEILWTTEARAAAWLAASGLAVDESGFVRVSDTLQSESHPDVFAAGDVAAMVSHPRPKSGVFAVRQGPPLARNLRRMATGQVPTPFTPQRHFLSLISTGDRFAVASRGPFAMQGAWVWQWKDRIDRRFMRRYEELPEMGGDAGEPAAPSMWGPPLGGPSASSMRCGGCGAKVGNAVLTRALGRVKAARRDDVLIGLDAPDDAAVVEVPACKAIVHTVDFFRSMIDDPYVFGKVAANHALGDLYAMGAEPQTALAVVTIPFGPEQKVEDTLTQLMAGAADVLGTAGAALVGGHTSEGAELGLGFAINGLVDRDRIMRKGGLRPGDRVILTKPIGTGTLFAADMRHRAKGRWISAAIASMTQSSAEAARCLLRHSATACTDVTGFGLVGHLLEMVRGSDVDVAVSLGAIPLLEGAEETARAGILSSLQPQNIQLRDDLLDAERVSDTPRFALLFDPQTAGGLLAGVAAGAAEQCINELKAGGYPHASIVGTVFPHAGRAQRITVRT